MTDEELFAVRLITERIFCEELFKHATIRLLAAKYAYYHLNKLFIKDNTYDVAERNWFMMGRGLGHLKEDETSPCVDWDANHPLAVDAIKYLSNFRLLAND